MYDRLACGWSEVYLFEQTVHETVGMSCVRVGVLVSVFQRNRTNRIYSHIYRHNLFYCALQILSFLRSEGLWQPWVEKSVGDIFPTAFFSLHGSVPHQTFSWLYMWWWSVTSDLFNIYLFYLFTWLHRLWVVACGIFSCGMQTFSGSMWGLVPQPGMELQAP